MDLYIMVFIMSSSTSHNYNFEYHHTYILATLLLEPNALL